MSQTTSPTPEPTATVKQTASQPAAKRAVAKTAVASKAPAKKASARKVAVKKVVVKKVVAKPAAAAKPAKAPKAPKAAKPAKVAKAPKVVRDSFTMPQPDFDIIDRIKLRAIEWKQPVKKSEVLRAALHALEALSDAKVRALLTGLAPIKKGRPKAD